MSQLTSVIIPCYNGQEYLNEALESIRLQTNAAREIIITDDGSMEPVLAPTAWNGPPITIIRTANRGLASARNTALSAATGEFVAFLDSDDLWAPRKLELQEAALSSNPRAVACFTQCVDEPGFFGFGPYPPEDVSDDDLWLAIWHVSFFPPSSVMARRQVVEEVGRFRTDFLNGEDMELWLRLMRVGQFIQVPQPLTKYRVHANQFTANIWKKLYGGKQARKAALEQHTDRMIEAGLPKSQHWYAYRCDMLLVYYRRQFNVARPLLWDYWTSNKGDLRVLFYFFLTLVPASIVTKWRGVANPDPAPQSQACSLDAWQKLIASFPVDR